MLRELQCHVLTLPVCVERCKLLCFSVCSDCVLVTPRSRAVSGRSVIFPLGNKSYSFVDRGNLLLCRSMLLLMVCCAKGARFLLEQPGNSSHPRWDWFAERVYAAWQFWGREFFWVALELMQQFSKVFRGMWWMGKFGGPSPKRHLGFSNDETFMTMLMRQGGYLSVQERLQLGKSKLTKRGVSGATNKPTFTGCKKHLKQSQCPDCYFFPACVCVCCLLYMCWVLQFLVLGYLSLFQALHPRVWLQAPGNLPCTEGCICSDFFSRGEDVAVMFVFLRFERDSEVKVPGPKQKCRLDMGKSDFELFRQHLRYMKDDIWEDAALPTKRDGRLWVH